MTKETGDFLKNSWLSIAFAGLLFAASAGLLYLMSFPNPSAREVFLQSVILTVASVVASLLTSKVYGEWSYSQNVRDRGVQIAGGVMVLKHQIERLVDWVIDKRETSNHDDAHVVAYDAT